MQLFDRSRRGTQLSAAGAAILPGVRQFAEQVEKLDHTLAPQPYIRLKSLETEQLVMSSRQVSPVYFDLLTSVCRAHGFAPRILHEVRSVSSLVAYVSCGQGVALVPSSMHKLAPENVVIRPLKEKIMVVTAAAVWNTRRHNPMVDEAIAWIRSQERPGPRTKSILRQT